MILPGGVEILGIFKIALRSRYEYGQLRLLSKSLMKYKVFPKKIGRDLEVSPENVPLSVGRRGSLWINGPSIDSKIRISIDTPGISVGSYLKFMQDFVA